MKRFAYLDKAGIMHVVEKKETAEEYRKLGKIVETDVQAVLGFPLDEKGKGVIVYGPELMKYEATDKKFIEPVKELSELYKNCIG